MATEEGGVAKTVRYCAQQTMQASANNKDCRLLCLPGELRNKIYQHLLQDTSPKRLDLLKATASSPHTALTLTCHQTYAETATSVAEAQQRFWRSHDFVMHSQLSRAPISKERRLSCPLSKLLPLAGRPVQYLEFVFTAEVGTSKPFTIRITAYGDDDLAVQTDNGMGWIEQDDQGSAKMWKDFLKKTANRHGTRPVALVHDGALNVHALCEAHIRYTRLSLSGLDYHMVW